MGSTRTTRPDWPEYLLLLAKSTRLPNDGPSHGPGTSGIKLGRRFKSSPPPGVVR